ncbi:MAG: protoporphyrinogen oxidase [Candidatus Omnitrophica bacterium]|nr:protoporphyrinogen oxidase [Candidatus Omnitrophota bacterium]
MKRIVVIGGGISGLAAAHRLAELSRGRPGSPEIILLEAANRFGGVIETHFQDGFLMEGGPDAFLTEKPTALDLCRRLGLGDQLLQTRPENRKSFVIRSGRPVPIPEGFFLTIPRGWKPLFRNRALSFRGKIRCAGEIFVAPRRGQQDESVADFIRRRFGREVFEKIGQPMIGGIYAANAEQLSLQATLPKFREMEEKFGSLIRAVASGPANGSGTSGPRYQLFVSLRGGMQTLVEGIIRDMPEVSLRCGCEAVSLQKGKKWGVQMRGGGFLEADGLCLAVPAYAAAQLLTAVSADLSGELSGIPYGSIASVHAVFRQEDLPDALRGFGLVVPESEKSVMIGCTFSSVKFEGRAPDGMVLVRIFTKEVGKPEEDLQKDLLLELARFLGIHSRPRFLWVRRHFKAMPAYPVGHPDRLSRIERMTASFPGLYLTGNGYRGSGLPEIIDQAEKTAERIFSQLLQSEGPGEAR